jgi:hypothetical protein
MLEWNFFGASCILAAYIGTLQDASAMHESVFQGSGLSILISTGIILGMHVFCYLLRNTSVQKYLSLWYTALAFTCEVSLFVILCQSIGKRGPQMHHIPVEYAYIPLLVVVLILSTSVGDDTPQQRHLLKSPGIQGASMLGFVIIITCAQSPNMSYPGNLHEMLPIFLLLVFIYAVPMPEILSKLEYVICSGICKSLVLTAAILWMNAAPRPDPHKFNRLHDFYTLRSVSHFDPQYILTSKPSPIQHVLSLRGFLGHVIKLIYLTTSCVWYEKVLQLQLWQSTQSMYRNSRNEVVIVGTITSVLLAVACTSKQHDNSHKHTHTAAMLWGLTTVVACCAILVLVCSKPFVDNRFSVVSLRYINTSLRLLKLDSI